MSAKKSGILIAEFTVKEILEKLDSLNTKSEEIHRQTLKTNGRVSELEKRSIGMWVSRNIWKTILLSMFLTVIIISDFRQPIIEWIIKLMV